MSGLLTPQNTKLNPTIPLTSSLRIIGRPGFTLAISLYGQSSWIDAIVHEKITHSACPSQGQITIVFTCTLRVRMATNFYPQVPTAKNAQLIFQSLLRPRK